jgi:hypothetical protein
MPEKKTFKQRKVLRQSYDIVQAKTPEELIRLVNLKTKFGWKCLGGMAYTPENKVYDTAKGTEAYAYCQAVFKLVLNKVIQ